MAEDDGHLELNHHGFCEIDSTNPIKTSQPGIFTSGAFQGPTDIPESVFSASGAGAQCGELLNKRRDKLTKERVYPPEQDVAERGAQDRRVRMPLRGQHLQRG